MIQVYRKEDYRSNPYENDEYDMVQVTLRMPKISWRLLIKLIRESGYFAFHDDHEEIEVCETHGIKGDYDD
jgi:hypothetical protein